MKARPITRVICLALPDGELPSEFRIFASGESGSLKGSFVFDEKAARDVMADFEKHGADIMIDLEHLSLERSPNYDPDARGWCRLELRDGELWAVDVRWTDDGAARLSGKRQRYISPAFLLDRKTRRVTSLINIAITAMPATHDLEPLVAASQRIQEMKLSSSDMKLAASLVAVVEQLASAQSPELKQLAADVDATLDKLMGSATGEAEPAADPAAPSPPEAMAAAVAMARAERKAADVIVASAREVTGKVDPQEVSGALVALGAAKDQIRELSTKVAELSAEQEKREVRELVAANRKKIHPAIEEKCLSMSKAALLAALEILPERDLAPKAPPTTVEATPFKLSAREIEACKADGVDPEKYAKTKAAMLAKRTHNPASAPAAE